MFDPSPIWKKIVEDFSPFLNHCEATCPVFLSYSLVSSLTLSFHHLSEHTLYTLPQQEHRSVRESGELFNNFVTLN